ncbi:hypothetical protein MHM89_14385 [Pseudoalteromonas sp. CNC9-20]|uniref:hypothetical protein n=1 Tax=Pseudoalteromonas sp. CNC9-20 TaxID=2917750 RepID=UPI001EF59342|nr:hypothetical protein [Pseudoalteromonas sp. CNC9-20]MCG7571111.1 hypothetical protein [Pseudoalteromonas sp. CNC9-20]
MKFLYLLLSVAFPAFANDYDVTWLRINAPPFSMPASSSDSGICDDIVDEIIARTPDLKHDSIHLPQMRLKSYFEQGKNVCVPCLIKRDNHPLVTFSTRTSVYPPMGIVTTAQKQRSITEKHGSPVRLYSLLNDKGLRYGQGAGRKYSPWIEQIKSRVQNNQAVTLNYRGADQASVLGDMLVNERIDFGIDYPFIATYYNRHHDAQLVTLPIANNQESLVFGAIGCAKRADNDFATTFINRINPIIRDHILPSESYRQHQSNWLSEYFDDFSQVYEKHLLTKKPAQHAGSEKRNTN